MRRTLLVALPLLAAACAPRLQARLAPPSAQRLVDAPIAPDRDWLAPRDRDHPLVGRIWDVRSARFVDEAALLAEAARADLVLLGETHDNPDHHLLQARAVRAITAAGRRPGLALEMLTVDQQPQVDAALARAPGDPDALGEAVRWSESRWPSFLMYRPILAAGLEAGLPVVATNLPRATVREIVTKGEPALDGRLRERLAREEPLPAEILAGLRDEMRESHCNELPEAMLDPLVLAQRARDARISERLVAADEGGRGAILIAGKGHVRKDRGVPAYLAKDAPGRTVLALAFVEAEPELREPGAYAEEWGTPTLPFDVVVFTPGAERDDPCAALRDRERKRREGAKPAPTPTPAQ